MKSEVYAVSKCWRRTHPAGNNRAFTLIEMLVAIAIVAVLAMLAFPLSSSVLRSGQAAACISNLRQIGGGFRLYAADHDGEMPPAYIPSSMAAWPETTWMFRIGAYIGEGKVGDTETIIRTCYGGVFHCPSIPGAPTPEKVSYSMNSFEIFTGAIYGSGNLPNLKWTSIDNQQNTALVVETESVNYIAVNLGMMYNPKPALRHNRRDNVLFCDGHVEPIAFDGLDWILVRKQGGTN